MECSNLLSGVATVASTGVDVKIRAVIFSDRLCGNVFFVSELVVIVDRLFTHAKQITPFDSGR